MSINTNRSSLTQIEGKTSAYTVSPVSVGSSWKSLSIGASHAVAIKNNGTLWAWGNNQYGQLGDGTLLTKASPVQIGSFTWLNASAGANHSMALRSDGLLFGWGLNSNYQLGNNATYYSNYWKAVASGISHTVLIRADNTLWGVGGNANGQLGNNTVTATASPIQIGTSSWSMVRASALSTYAIDITGRLFTWGFNGNGELGLNDVVARSSPVQVGTSLWSTVASQAGFTTLNTSAYAIDISNNLFAWGMGTNGQIGDNAVVSRSSPTQIGTKFLKVAASDAAAAAINVDGKLFTWGTNVNGQLGFNDTVARSAPTQIPTAYVWSDVASAQNTNYALTNTGLLFAWGVNTNGIIGDGTTINRSVPVQIMTNISKLPVNPYLQTSVIDNTGKLWMWGNNTAGALGDGTAISRSAPVQIGNSNWAVVSSTISGTLGITTDNKLWGWGQDAGTSELYFRETDAGVTQVRSSPVQTGAGLFSDSPIQIGTSSWTQVSAGVDHTIAIRSDKTLWAWGSNRVGQLMAGQFAGQLVSSPVQVGSSSYVSVSAGNSFSLAITTDNKLIAAGNNSNGQLGSSALSTSYSWTMIVETTWHALAIRNDGLLFAWGDNTGGQLGDGTTIHRSSPVQIGTESWTYISAEAGSAAAPANTSSFAIRKDGALFGWGYGGWGQLGNNSSVNRSSPVQIGTTTFSKVEMGVLHHVIATGTDGSLWTWGNNQTGQLGDGTTISRSSPAQINTGSWSQIAAGYSTSYAIRSDSILFGWGGNSVGELGQNDVVTPRPVITQIGNSSWTQVFAKRGIEYASGTVWALRTDGKLFGWGTNSSNQIGDGTTINRSSPVQVGSYSWSNISAHGLSRVGTQPDGSLWYWGTKTPAAGSDFATTTFTYSWTLISGGNFSSYGVRQDGTLWSWGYNNTGQIGDNTTVSRSAPVQITIGSTYWKDVSGGGSFAVAIDSTNRLYAWGKNDVGQMGIGSNVSSSSPVQIAAPLSSFTSVASGYTHSLAIDNSGKLWSWGSNSFRQLGLTDSVYGYLSWSQVSTSTSHSVFIRSDGRLFTTGYNGTGALGDGTVANKNSPVIIGTEKWIMASAGIRGDALANYTLAIRQDGTLWAWGYNNTGELGDGSTINRSSPVQISTLSWIYVAAGTSGNYAIRNDNMLFAWGGGISGYFSGSPVKFFNMSSPVQVSTKSYSKIATNSGINPVTGAYSLALGTDGKLWAWGNNSVGQLGQRIYTSWTSVAITNAQSRTMFGIKDGGILYAWGSETNTMAQINDGTTVKSSPVVVGQDTVDYVKFASVVGGLSHIYSLTGDGKLYGMGVAALGYNMPDTYSWSQIASTGLSTYAIRSDGLLFAWGLNTSGQLGDGTSTTRSQPVQIGFGNSWSILSVGVGSAPSVAAIDTSGKLWAWGLNTQGQLGDGTTAQRNTPTLIASSYTWIGAYAGNNSHMYLRNDGLLFGSGYNSGGHQGNGGLVYRSSPVQVSSKKFSSFAMLNENITNTATVLAIDTNQNLFTWGSGLYGSLGDNTTVNRSSPLQIGTSKWLAVASAARTAAAITIDNRLFTWGSGSTDPQANTLGSSSLSWKSIFSAGSTTFGIDTLNRLWSWGSNSNGVLGQNTSTINRSAPVQIGVGNSWVQISSSGDFALAAPTTGGLWSWGNGISGALGNSTTVTRSSPVQISSNSFPVFVAGVFQTAAAIDSNGFLYTWGSNGGVLGDGTTINRSAPVQIGNNTWASVSIGNSVVYAIRSDKTLWSWGLDTAGQLGTNGSGARSSPVQIGTSSWLMVSTGFKNFVAAIDINNRLFAWGYNTEGEMGDNTTIARSSPVQVSAGTAGALVFTGTGSIVSTSNINLGAGLFTIEGWFYRTSAVGSNTSFWGSTNGNGSNPKIIFNQMNTGELRVWQNDAAVLTTSTTLVPQNTWVHIAVVRDTVAPGVIKIYVNGQLQPSTTNPSNDYSGITGTFNIGADGESAYSPFPGSISNFRVVTGVAVYTGNFTVPTTALTTSQSSGTNISAITESQTQLLAYASTTNDASIYGRILTLTNASTSFLGPVGLKWSFVQAMTGGLFAKTTDNVYWAWGQNTFAELALNDSNNRSSPVQVGSFSANSVALNNIVIQPSSSSTTTNFILYNNGSALGWGYNAAGGIGDNTTINKTNLSQVAPDSPRSSPVQVGTDYWNKITGGVNHFVGQQINGKIYTWGSNSQGQLGTGDTGARGAPTLIDNTSYAVAQVAAGVSNTFFTNANKKIYGFGGNSNGELGDGSTLNRSSPTQLGTNTTYTLQQFFAGSSYTQVASYSHTMTIKSDGTLWTWGRNNLGQLGNSSTIDSSSPVQVAGSWSQVEVGFSTSVALRTDGTLWAWGDNSYGQLGQANTVGRSSPVQIAGSWTKIAATGYATFAINTSGQLFAWGNNTNHGQLGQSDTVSRSSPVQIAGSWTNINVLGNSNFGVKVDNTLWAWGGNLNGELGLNDLVSRSSPVQVSLAGIGTFILPKSSANWGAASAGNNATSYIKDNLLYVMGNNVQGQMGQGAGAPATLSSPVQVGTAFGTYIPSPVQVGTDSWTQISAGYDHAAAITTDSRLFTWGGNSFNQLGGGGGEYLSISTNGNTSTNSAGSNFGFNAYVRSDGTLMTVGLNSLGQLGDGTTVNKSSPVQVGATGYWRQVTVGSFHTLAIDYLGRLWAWGTNSWGQLGTNNSTNYSSPVQISATNSWVQVTASDRNSYAIDTSGKLWAWGNNAYGQLGDNTVVTKSSPIQVGTATDWTGVYTGAWSLHAHAIKNDNTLWGWGYNAGTYGRLGDGTNSNKSSPVQITGSWTMVSHGGEYYSQGWNGFGVKTDGTLWGWGVLFATSTPSERTAVGVTSWLAVHGSIYGAFALSSDQRLYYMNDFGLGGGNSYFDWVGTNTGTITQPVLLSTGVSFKNVTSPKFRLGQVWPTPDNKLYAWGDNSTGLLADSTTVSRSSPVQLGSNPTAFSPTQVVSGSWSQVNASLSYTTAIKSDSTLWAWGYNNVGQLGTNDTVNRSDPTLIPSGSSLFVNAVQYTSNAYQTIPYNAAFNFGSGNFTMEAWVYPTTTGTNRGIVDNWQGGGEFHFRITTSNTLQFVYTNVASGISSPEYNGTTTVSANVWTHVAIVRNGTAWRFYINGVADATAYTSSDTLYYYNGAPKDLKIAAGADLSSPFTGKIAGLRIVKGVAVYTGNFTVPNTPLTTTQSAGTNISAITGTQTLLLCNQLPYYADNSANNWVISTSGNPTIVSASELYSGLGIPPVYSWTVVGTGVGAYNNVIRIDGTLWGTGSNGVGQIGDSSVVTKSSYVAVGTTTVAFNAALTNIDNQSYTLATAGYGQSLAIRSNGTLWGWGLNSQNQLGFGPGEVWTSVTGGTFQAAAMTSLGRMYTWGANTYGSVGDGTTAARTTPWLVPNSISWTQMSASGDSMFAIKTDGTLWVWGANYNGQLGLGDTVSRSSPVQLGSATNWTKVSANKVYVTALNSLGQLWAWGANSGSNSSGSLGDGTTIDRSSPVQVAGSWSILGMYDAGGSLSATTYAIKPDGTMYAWGNNGSGQFGDSTVISRSQPTQIGIGYSWSMVGCTSQTTLALRSDGTLWVTGVGTNGTLGNNTTVARSSPVQLGTSANGALIQWKSIAVGTSCAAAIRANDNSLWAWGYNLNGALGDGTLVNRSSPVQIGQSQWTAISGLGFGLHGITIDNTLFGWGGSYTGNATTVSSSSPVVVDVSGLLTAPSTNVSSPTQIAGSWSKVSTGYHHTLAIKNDGTLWAWGNNSEGQLGVVNSLNLLSLGATSFVKSDNTLWSWGNNASGQVGDVTLVSRSSPVQVFAPLSWSQISDSYDGGNEASGETGRIGIDAYGYLYTWGKNTYGQLGTNNTTGYSTPQKIGSQRWTQLSTPFAIKEDGTLWGWGYNASGSVGDGTTIGRSSPVQIGTSSWTQVSGSGHAIRIDGTLWGWGYGGMVGDNTTVYRSSPVQIGTLSNWKYLASTQSLTSAYAVNYAGQLFAWGSNQNGQLGDGTTANRSSPVQISTLSNITAISSYNSKTLAIDINGGLFAVGYNASGQIGDGTTIGRSSAVQIAGSWVACASGFGASLAIRTDGTLWAWGIGSFGQLGNSSTVSRSSPVQVGTDVWQSIYAGSMAVYGIRNNTTYVWGGNSAGELGLGDTVSRSSPVQVAASYRIFSNSDGTLAITTTGGLVAYGGYNNAGQLGINDTINRSSPVQVGTSGMNWTSAVSILGFNAALKDDNTLWMWGANLAGQLGDNSTISRSSPVQVAGSWNVVSGNGQTTSGWVSGIKADGTLWIWGMNFNGYFGDTFTALNSYRSSPVQVGSSSWTALASTGVGTLLAVDAAGRLYAWGSNAYGQLGDGTVVSRSSPVQIMSGRSFTQVAANYYASYALETTGTLWTMGNNAAGYLGDNTTVSKSSPVQVNTSSWANIAATGLHAMGSIIVNGVTTLWSWGANTNGQLGDETVINRSSPVQISALYNSDKIRYSSPVQVGLGYSWINVSAGPYATIAARQDGTVWTWGMNLVGQLGLSDIKYRSSPVQVPSTAAGSVISLNSPKQISMNGDPFGGADTGVWIQSRDGGLYATGYNLYGQVGNTSTVNRSVPVQIASAGMGSAPIIPINLTSTRGSSFTNVGLGLSVIGAISSTGALYTWGSNTYGQLGYSLLTGVTVTSSPATVGNNIQSYKAGENAVGTNSWSQISAGYNHALAIDTDKKLFGWGNYAGTNPIVASTFSWKTFIMDGVTTAIRSDDTLWLWGDNSLGQLADNTTVTKYSPVQFGTDSWKQISNGINQVAGIKTDGTLWTWGYNAFGQLGDGTVVSRSSPVQLAGSWSSVVTGVSVMAAIQTNGTLWTWGSNTNGQLGHNTTVSRSSPVQVGTRTDWKSIEASLTTTYAVDNDGNLFAWGLNTYGETGLNDIVPRSSPVQIGSSKWTSIAAGYGGNGGFAIAIRADNTLWGWGYNLNGSVGDVTSVDRSSPVQVGTSLWSNVNAGPFYSGSFATDINGRLFAWGYNVQGQLGNNTTTPLNSPVLVNASYVLLGAGSGVAANDPNGLLYAWGSNTYGNYGTGYTISVSSPVLVINNTISPNTSSPVQLMSGSWTHINAGNDFSIIADSNNTLYFWGRNDLHQSGTTSYSRFVTSPVAIGTSTYDTGAGNANAGAIFAPPREPTVPNKPVIYTATAISTTSAEVQFTAPFDNGGSAITSFTAVSSPGNITGTLVGSSSGTITVEGLTSGTVYTFTVYATNAIGNSALSNPSNPIQAWSLPGAPILGTAVTVATGIAIPITAPYDFGGTPITSYTIVSTPGSISQTVYNAGTITMTGLSTSTTYTFAVYATNAVGNSITVNSTPATTFNVPGAPTIGTATAINTTTTAVTFTAPTSNGGTPVISYTAISSPGGITGTVTQSESGTIYVTGLTNINQVYTFTVYATNGMGNSTSSSASNQTVSIGEQAYTTPGSYSWVVPTTVSSISVVAVGPGGSGGTNFGAGGGAGALSYGNNIAVVPGTTYTVVVGSPGASPNASYFNTSGFLFANPGSKGTDGNIGQAAGGGGGAGGYSGNGGQGGYATGATTYITPGTGGTFGGTASNGGGNGGDGGRGSTSNVATLASGAGSGGGGAGGGGGTGTGKGGGGVGIYGQGANGVAAPGNGGSSSPSIAQPLSGGSGGGYSTDRTGALYGGGGAGGGGSADAGLGGSGAVRIIWPGTTRQFPSTNTGLTS